MPSKKFGEIIGRILANRVQRELDGANGKVHLMLSFSYDELLEFARQFQPKSREVIKLDRLEQLEETRSNTSSDRTLPVFLVWSVEDAKPNGWLITNARNEGVGHLVVLLNGTVDEIESIAGLKQISPSEIQTSEIVGNVLLGVDLSDSQTEFVEILREVTRCDAQALIRYLEEVREACNSGEDLDDTLGRSLPKLRLFHDPPLLSKTAIQIEDRLRRNEEYSSLAKLEDYYERRIIPRLESGRIKLDPAKLELLDGYLADQDALDVFSRISYEEFHGMVKTAKDKRIEPVIEEETPLSLSESEVSSAAANDLEAPNLLLGLVRILADFREPLANRGQTQSDIVSSIVVSSPESGELEAEIPMNTLDLGDPNSFRKLKDVNELVVDLIRERLDSEDASEDERSAVQIDVRLESRKKSRKAKEVGNYTLRLSIQPDFVQGFNTFYKDPGFFSAEVASSNLEKQFGNGAQSIDKKLDKHIEKLVPNYLSSALEAFVRSRRKLIEELQLGEAISLVGDVEGYVSSYASLLRGINSEENEEPELGFIQQLMQLDCVYTQDRAEALVLPFHPLRIRWQYCYEKWLLGILKMLAESPRSYSNINLDMVAGVELRGIPPIICLDRDKLLISRKSIGSYEIYTSKRLSAGNVSHTLVTKRIKEYLRLCPFAERGLKIDFVHAGDGDFAFRVLKDVLKDEDKVHIDVHLYGEEGDTDLGEVFDRESYDRTDVTERFFMRNSNEFLPRLVYLKSCRNPKEISEGKVHLSILSNLKVSEVDAVGLGETYARTYGDADNSTLFDMDIFSSRYEIVNPEDAQPRRTYLVAPDDWLAMHYQQCCVWAERGTPARGVRAYVTEADLAKAEDLIMALHKRSDWVVIFDESIYREYLEAPEKNIKILDVRTGLGAQEAFTMTVSSTNDEVVKHSIGKVLERVFEKDYKTEYRDCVFEQLRRLSGKLALQCATGKQNKIRELLGDIIAANSIRSEYPAIIIPLDDYTEWFKGEDKENRADILKASLQNGILYLDIIEAKFVGSANAKASIEKARRQLENTANMIEKLFAPNSETERLDAQLQYERLYHAIADHSSKIHGEQLGEDTLRTIRDGAYKKIEINTHVCCYIHDVLDDYIDRNSLLANELFGPTTESIEGRDRILSHLDNLLMLRS